MNTTVGNPFDIPEILDNILVKLDLKSTAISTRLICKAWNESWIRFYMRQPEKQNQIETEYISKLHSILTTSNCPFVLFRSLNCQWEHPGIQDLLNEFGSNLKSLNLTFNSAEVSPLLSILVDLCTNLEEFKLCICTPVTLDGFDIETSQFKGRQLPNLKRLFIWDSHQDQTESMDLVLLKWILTASVNLKSLNFKSDISPSLTLESIKKMDEDKAIKIKLDELDINCTCTEQFHPLEQYLDIRLIQNLKSLTLYSCERFLKLEIANMLLKLANSLEILTLKSHKFPSESAHPNNTNRNLEFPYMPKLKIFNNLAFPWVELLRSKNVLANVPNLKKLTLAPSTLCENFFNLADYFIGSQFWSEPHLALTELIVLGKMSSTDTGETINRLFPNLSKLYIGMCQQLYVEMHFPEFAEMKKLEDLTVKFPSMRCKWNAETNLSRIFGNFASSKQLRRLTIINTLEKIEGDLFGANILQLLAVLPNLLCLRLYNVTMTIATANRFLEAMRSRPTSKTKVEFIEVDLKQEILCSLNYC